MNHAVIVRLAYSLGVLFNAVRVEVDPSLPEELPVAFDDVQNDLVFNAMDAMNTEMARLNRIWRFVRLSSYVHRVGRSEIIRVEHLSEPFTMIVRVCFTTGGQLVLESMQLQRTTPMVPSEDGVFSLSRGRSTFQCKMRRRDASHMTPLWSGLTRCLEGMIDTGWFDTTSLATMRAGHMTLQTV